MTPETKKKFDELLAGVVKGTVMEAFAEVRKENETKTKEIQDSVTKALSEHALQTKAKDADVEKGHRAASMVRLYAAAKGDTGRASAIAKEWNYSDEIVKALATQPLTAGGFIIPPAYSNELIELLYNRTAVRKLGALSMPMPNGTLTIPKLKSGTPAAYIGEGSSDPAQQDVFGVVTLAWKKLRATVAISNDLIRYSNPKADDVVRTDLVNQFAVAEDYAFIAGVGSGVAPKGLRYWIPAGSDNAATSANGSDLTKVIADLFSLPSKLESFNIPMNKPGWIFNPRVKYFLMQVRDSVGNFYFQAEMLRGTLLGVPFVSTNQVNPDDDGDASKKTHIFFGDFSDAIIGESSDLTFDVSQEAAYDNGSGLSSAFALDQTVIRGIARHDFGVRRVESFAALNTVQWGA